MHSRTASLIAVTFFLGMAAATADADTLRMPQGTSPNGMPKPVYALQLPAKGMTMRQVEKRFGAPQAKLPPVGKPPITRWVYPNYTVYFEYRYVIHSVLRRK